MQEFAEDTNAMRELCPNEKCCSYIGFQNAWAPHFLDVHIQDQSHCVFLPGGESMVDYIGTSESVSADWQAVRWRALPCLCVASP
ncbi:MAG: hypothetical protein HC767_11995 [Akkermansiaceae bacterium]|nr:hypothetical protein [Akkermansiaceae bacterium]